MAFFLTVCCSHSLHSYPNVYPPWEKNLIDQWSMNLTEWLEPRTKGLQGPSVPSTPDHGVSFTVTKGPHSSSASWLEEQTPWREPFLSPKMGTLPLFMSHSHSWWSSARFSGGQLSWALSMLLPSPLVCLPAVCFFFLPINAYILSEWPVLK